ncbi:DNA/RNA non-specific endonuclease [Macrococcus armenti]|uniref:DNA/RNA non-specific endonuclease n=1 Tax=Macrococcus armenti TaxID=2875764 RepID=UPI001CCCDE32|nr:DNA/RNA non-specific endonuclease [Macrococcus armenti]UBH08101.1 DNA/RNA non-specific endonuclease [Macrococcus armenti]
MSSIYYRTSDYESELRIMESIIEAVTSEDFEKVDDAITSARGAIRAHDEDGVCTLNAEEVAPSGRKMMRFYEDAMHDYTANIDKQLKEKIDDPFCTALDNFVNNVSNVDINKIVIKHGSAAKGGRYGADGVLTMSDTKAYKADDVFNLEELLESEPHIQKVIDQSYQNAIKQKDFKDLKREDFQDMMTKGASFEYESYTEERARLKAEEEARLELERQERIEMIVDVAAWAGIGVLTFFVPPAGAAAGTAYTMYSAANVAAGKNLMTGRKYSTSERIIEGASIFPVGKVIKGVGKPFLNATAKTATKTTAGQFIKSGLKETSRMASGKMMKLKLSYQKMVDKADVGYRVASMIERVEGKKEAIQHATKAWYQNQGKKVAQYVDDRMVPVVQKAASHGVDRYNRVADALNKLGVRPQYAYAGIGTDVVKKISKRDMDQYISKAASNIKHKVNPVSAGDQTIDLTKNSGKKLKVGEDDAHLITRVDYKKKEHIVRGWRRRKELKPNIEFITPEGYLYRTDEFGRIKYVEATELVLKKAKRKTYMQRVVGREFRKKDDDGGHLIASQFAGSGDLDNLVPMNSKINRVNGEWYEMEKTWADALKETPPKKVQIKIEPVYSGDSLRPDEFNVYYTIGDEKHFKNIVNEGA